jgi:hypothetical protein
MWVFNILRQHAREPVVLRHTAWGGEFNRGP